jgi:hypothetical protein
MTPRPPANRLLIANRLLTITLLVLTFLPVLVFATNFTESKLVRSARQRVREREGRQVGASSPISRPPLISDSARREAVRLRRSVMHPSANSMLRSAGFQLLLLVVIGAVGRRVFALRL